MEKKGENKKESVGTAESDSVSMAREILDLEAAAITAARDRIGPEFHAAVALIREIPPGGRLVLLGMGKAGFIAQKISAREVLRA